MPLNVCLNAYKFISFFIAVEVSLMIFGFFERIISCDRNRYSLQIYFPNA